MIEHITKTAIGYKVVLGGQTLFVPDDAGNQHYQMVQEAIAAGVVVQDPPAPVPVPSMSRSAFCVALTKTTPPIFTAAEALAALEAFPPKFTAALADKPLEYQAAAIEAWRETKTVARNAPLFLDLLAFYAAQAGLTDAQAQALGDSIFAGAGDAG